MTAIHGWYIWILCSATVLLPLALMSGCTPGIHNFVQALNEAHVSNCVFIQGAMPPYGTAYVYTKSGELDCMALWRERNRAVGP